MQLFDVHTHLQNASSASIFSSTWKEDVEQVCSSYRSASIHPWYLTEENAAEQLEWLKQQMTNPTVIAIGEAGLDKTIPAPISLQQSVFESVIQLSESVRLPLIIHAVRCQQELLLLKKRYQPQMPWIIHGFRGKREMAHTYIHHGFYLSIGQHFQGKALEAIPLNRLFIETDEGNTTLLENYTSVAQSYNLPIEKLAKEVEQNVQNVFFTR